MFLLKAEQIKRYEKEKVGNLFLVGTVAFVRQVAFLHCVKVFCTKSPTKDGRKKAHVKTNHTRTQLEMKD